MSRHTEPVPIGIDAEGDHVPDGTPAPSGPDRGNWSAIGEPRNARDGIGT